MSGQVQSFQLRDTCLYCDTRLVANPVFRHWRHCPSCEPEWVEAINNVIALSKFVALRTAARDPRGAPHPRPA